MQTLETTTAGWRVRDFGVVMVTGLMVGAIVLLVLVGLDAQPTVRLIGSALGQYAGHLLALGLLARTRAGVSGLGFAVQPTDLAYLFLGILLQLTIPLLFLPLANLVGEGEPAQALTGQIQQLESVGARAAMAIVVAVLAPVTEELMFRGVLLKAMAANGRRAMIITALVFSLFHILGLTGDVLRGIVLTVPTFFLVGLILARVTMKKDRLGPAIFIHSGFNLLALFVLFLPQELVEQAARAGG
jgi:membrane protease YdiL (CAAX protease family)